MSNFGYWSNTYWNTYWQHNYWAIWGFPEPRILINSGQQYTSNLNVVLNLSGTDIIEMRFSNDGLEWSAWEPYKTLKSWVLAHGTGLKIVYAEFRTVNYTNIVTDTITLQLTEKQLSTIKNETYSDLQFNLDKTSGNNDISRVVEEDAINQSIHSLLNTQVGERFFNPGYGTRMKQLLFEPLSYGTAKTLLSEIEYIINIYEGGRVSIKELNININRTDKSYEIFLEYEMKNTGKIGKFEFVLKKI